MKIVRFNKAIFNLLVRCGFKYCYSKTVADNLSGQIRIFLTPIGFKPNIRNLPLDYDTYFTLAHEPKHMATGIDKDTTVYIDLDHTLIEACHE